MLTTYTNSIDTIVIIATTSSSITLSLTGIGLIVIPISTDIACGLTISDKVVHEVALQMYSLYKKQYQKDHQPIKFFDKLWRISLQDNVLNKNEYEAPWSIFTRYVDEKENASFFL